MAKYTTPTSLTLIQSVTDYKRCGLGNKLIGNIAKCTTDEQCVYGPDFDPATGKTKHPHQRRVPGPILSGFLQKVKQMNPQKGQFKDFDEFFDATCNFTNTGPSLMVYDYCLRKGAQIGLMPDKYVYLFRGAKEGYKLISGKSSVHYRVSIDDMRNNPAFGPIFSGYPHVTSAIIEDILCNYHQRISGSIKPSNNGCNGNSVFP